MKSVILLGDMQMNPESFERALRAFQRRAPFRPFTVAPVNGDRIQVDHPEAMVLRGGMAVFIAEGGVPTLFDYASVRAIGNNERESLTFGEPEA